MINHGYFTKITILMASQLVGSVLRVRISNKLLIIITICSNGVMCVLLNCSYIVQCNM